jgi:hypothetical protein
MGAWLQEKHLAGQGDLGVVGVAQQLRLLVLERQSALDERRVVARARRCPRYVCAVELLPQRPARTVRITAA